MTDELKRKRDYENILDLTDFLNFDEDKVMPLDQFLKDINDKLGGYVNTESKYVITYCPDYDGYYLTLDKLNYEESDQELNQRQKELTFKEIKKEYNSIIKGLKKTLYEDKIISNTKTKLGLKLCDWKSDFRNKFNNDLSNLDLSELDLENADFNGCNFSNSILRNVNLVDAELVNTNFTNANLSDASLYYADLENANLSNANLFNTSLTNANLTNANLSNTDLTHAKFFNADLTNTNFKNTIYENFYEEGLLKTVCEYILNNTNVLTDENYKQEYESFHPISLWTNKLSKSYKERKDNICLLGNRNLTYLLLGLYNYDVFNTNNKELLTWCQSNNK